ncbi:MAG: DUF3253 domain-containing protein [Geminicoccaceae bacterium]|nr:DUF3253 domain-containing protein [Geminicoccaceae bacterium]MCX8100986.1 DUF3253 domain-containing protein [Geminicoccaceae bacterium]MDW8370347.1 DUF3253 domain-containing protein [Geminicoccaceae bacterium]
MAPADPTRSSSRPQHSSPQSPGNGALLPISAERIAAAIREAVAARGPGKSLCPSEIARSLAAEEAAWRALMPAVRAVAARLAETGELLVTQRGRPVDPATAKGPIRLALPAKGAEPGDRATPGYD